MNKKDKLKKLKSQNIQNSGYETKIAHNKKIKQIEHQIKIENEDIHIIKNVELWSCEFALPLKRVVLNGNYEFGCITPDNRLAILKTTIFDFNPYASVTNYNSVEKMIEDGWMID